LISEVIRASLLECRESGPSFELLRFKIKITAWLFMVPPRVREAAGLPARSVRVQAVTWITVTIQCLIVTTIGAGLDLSAREGARLVSLTIRHLLQSPPGHNDKGLAQNHRVVPVD
jgi:hypothetical protein